MVVGPPISSMAPFDSVLLTTGRTSELEAKLQQRLRKCGEVEKKGGGKPNLPAQEKHMPAPLTRTLPVDSLQPSSSQKTLKVDSVQAVSLQKESSEKNLELDSVQPRSLQQASSQKTFGLDLDSVEPMPAQKSSESWLSNLIETAEPTVSVEPTTAAVPTLPIQEPNALQQDVSEPPTVTSPKLPIPDVNGSSIPESGNYGETVSQQLEQHLAVRLPQVEGEDGIAEQITPREQSKVQPMVMRLNGQRKRRSTGEDTGSPSSDDRTPSHLSRKLLNLNSPMQSSPDSKFSSPSPQLLSAISATSEISTMCMDDDDDSDAASDVDSSDDETQGKNKELELEYDDCFDLLNHMPREKALKVAQNITVSESQSQALSDQNKRLSSVIGRVSSELEAARDIAQSETSEDAQLLNLLDHLAADLAEVHSPSSASNSSAQGDRTRSTALAAEENLKEISDLLANHYNDLAGNGSENSAMKSELLLKVEELLAEISSTKAHTTSQAEDACETQDALSEASSDAEAESPLEMPEAEGEVKVFFRRGRKHDQVFATAVERVGGTPAPPPRQRFRDSLYHAYELGTIKSVVEVGYASANSTYHYTSCGAASTLEAVDTTVEYAGAALEVATDQLSELASTASDPLYQAAEKVSEVFSLSWTSDAWSQRAAESFGFSWTTVQNAQESPGEPAMVK